MAINKIKNQANHFWPSFRFKTLLLIFVFQALIMTLAGSLLIFFGEMDFYSYTFWIIIGGLTAVSYAMNLLIFFYTAKPTRDLMAAITHTLGQPSGLIVPELNISKNERSGFNQALDYIINRPIINTNDQAAIADKLNEVQAKLSILTDILDTTSCGIVAINNQHEIAFSNKATPTFIDKNGKKSLGLIFNGVDTLETWIENCAESSLRAERVWTRISNNLPGQENRRFFDVVASYQKGRTTETVLILVDRTSVYSIDEDNLDFLSFAAHELRGPITVIRGYLDVLEDELTDEFVGDQHELFNRLIVSANRLSGYIDNILNTSRYDRRHLKVNLTESTVAAVYDTIKDDMQLRAGSQNRLLATEISNDLPTIAVDASSMSEVLSNLIDNAIKYSNEGGSINVSANLNGDFVDISVKDNGIGMPESVVSNLFQKFYRSHRSRETVAGTGIGLYISKAIVESHGGKISVRSEDGRGTTFTVSLPIYSTIADKLKSGDNSNEGLISEGRGWIKNHSMYRS